VKRARLTRRRLSTTLALLAVVLAVAAALALALGSEHVPPGQILAGLAARVTGGPSPLTPEQQAIVFDIRLPRLVLAIVVGAALSVAGAAFQALLRNPLAEPYVLGVSGGAALGAVLAVVFAASIPLSRTVAGFVGAAATIAVVYALGQGREGAATDRLILAGVIVNAFLGSIIIFLLTLASDVGLRGTYAWLIGDLSGSGGDIVPVAVLTAAGALVVFANARSLNLLMLGEHDAASLGVAHRRVRLTVYLAASLATGAAVSVSGMIGFVGLIVPHGVRLAVGSDNRLVAPASALVGGAFLVTADALARTLFAPREVHIGVVTALVGAPVFVYLLRRVG
jgi:iron complex transport system permease protein